MLTTKRPRFRFRLLDRVDGKKTTKKTRFMQASLFAIAGLVAFSAVNPGYALQIFNAINPADPVRMNVKPLKSPENSPAALPSMGDANKQLLETQAVKPAGERKVVKELTNERQANSKTFLNSDGTKTMEVTADQQHYREDAKSPWKEIDNSLEQKKTRDGARYFEGEAGAMSSTIKRVSQGVSVDAEDKTIVVKPVGGKDVQPERVDDDTIIYRDVWPGVDLEYQLRGEAVKEMIIVRNKNAPTSYDFNVDGGEVIEHPTRKGELGIKDMSEDYSFSALTLSVGEHGVIDEERVTQKPTSNGINVAFDKEWFKSQPESSFPMKIDPTFTKSGDASFSYKMYKSTGFSCNASNCYINTGSLKDVDGSWKHWRTYFRFNYDALKNKTILTAKAEGAFEYGDIGITTSKTLTLGHASCTNKWNCAYSTAGSAATTTNYNIAFTNKLKSLVSANNFGAWWVLKGQEGSSKSYKPYKSTKITVTYDTPTPMAAAASPANKATVVTTQPKLQVNNVTDADGDAVKYYFRVTTNPDAETGAVINSGWISSREWTVPEHILQDGRTYYWHTYTKGYAQTNPNWVRSFKVDMRTGKNSTQAYEEVGPISVDLATGNAATSAESHSISALGGDVGISLNYNTPALVQSGAAQKTATKYGLTGYYYNDTAGTKTFPSNLTDPSRLLMKRNDSKLSFNWGAGAPSPGLPADKFLVRWKGYITVPEAGSYTLGVDADDGVRIKLGTGANGADETAFDGWNYVAGERWGTAKSLSANQPIPITVEYYESTSTAKMKLLIKSTSLAAQEMPVTWLAPNANVLPDGWELGVGDEEVNYERLQIESNAAILSDSTGQKYEYTWNGSGYKAPENQEAILLRNDNNTYTVLDEDGSTYVFDAEGKLTSFTLPEDDRQPAALKYEYAGNPSRLVKISDGVNNGRNGTLHYSGDNECDVMSGFDAVPAGYLCAFKTTDGKKTTFQYKNDSLARIVQPGDDYEDYGYDSFGRIISYRDSLANDALAYGARPNDASVTTEIAYNQSGKITEVTAPAPTPGATREKQTLDYQASTTIFHAVGAPEPHGFSRKVTYDSAFRTLTDTDVANLTTTTEWHETKDLVLSTTEPTGLKSTTIYNDNDLPIDTYGAAPAPWFGSDRKPLSNYVDKVPHIQTNYDEDINGPAVTWYNYLDDSLSGAPLRHATGFDSNDKSKFWMNVTTEGSPAVPVTPTNGATNVGFRATGKINVPADGNYTLTLSHANAARIFIDNELVIDGWSYRSNTVTTKTATIALKSSNPAQIVVEYANVGGGETKFSVQLSGNGVSTPSSSWGSLLRPSYGLETSITAHDAELGSTRTEITYSAPEYGQVDKTVVDSTGLNYENKATHEAYGTGFLRQTSNTLPGGSKTTYEYYSATDTEDNPCTPEVDTALQGGFGKKTAEPDPDGDGSKSGRSYESIYDATGNVVASRYNDEPWSCTTYDDRNRVVSISTPAHGGKTGSTITYDYLVDDSPFKTSVSDASGTITTVTDLLGRTVEYVDVNGKITQTTYDTYGKATSKISPIGTETFEYDSYDRLTSHKLDSIEFAAVSYDDYGRINGVNYRAGISLDEISRDQLGRETGLTFTDGNSEIAKDVVTRYTSGATKDGTENGVSKSYTYDKLGRLVNAEIGDNEFTYSFDTTDASCSSVADNNPNAGKSGNRTRLVINGQTTTYCYDEADRLITSSNNTLTDVQHDQRGNTTSIGDTTHKTELGYDVNDRNIRVASGNKEITYVRDALDRITSRTLKDNNTVVEQIKYGFTDDSDATSFTLDSNGAISRTYLALPGGVTATINPSSTSAGALTYSIPNVHGDTMATVNADGTVEGKYMTGSFGEPLPIKPSQLSSGLPANTGDATSAAYLGKHQKITDETATPIEGGIVQMGARPYIPALGRFASVDPIEGGTDNNYAYPTDPVNTVDTDGEAWWWLAPVAVKVVVHVAKSYAKKKAAKQAAKKLAEKKRKEQQRKLAREAIKRHAQQVARKGAGANRKITDWAPNYHGASRMAARGVTKNRAKSIVKSGRKTEQYVNGEWRYRYENAQGVVVLNSKGRVVTAWVKSSRYFNK